MRSIRNVLVVHPYGIGDLLFVTPVLRALRLVPTVEKVDLLLGSRTEAMIRSNPHIDKIYVIDKDRFHARDSWDNVCEVWELGKKLRKNQYDLILDYSLRREYAFWGRFFLGVPRVSGLDYKGRARLHTHRTAIPNGFTDRHVIEYYADVAEKVGIPVEERKMELYLTEDMRQRAKAHLHEDGVRYNEPFLVVSPGGGESWGKDAALKRWPAHHFAELINQMASESPAKQIVLLGSEKERPLCEELKKLIHTESVMNMAGRVNLNVAAAILEQATLFLGNDGGLVHIAHALRTPLIAIYGPADPKNYGPFPISERAVTVFKDDTSCRPCYQKFRYDPNCRAIEDLSVEFVLKSVRESGILERLLSAKKSQGFFR